MAIIYRYHLRESKLRVITDLSIYNNPIREITMEHFSQNLKDVNVYSDYFEFRLFQSVENYQLRKLGRKLKKVIQADSSGFIRMPQILYMQIYPDYDTKNYIVEFLDHNIFEDLSKYSLQAQNYYHKIIENTDQNTNLNLTENQILNLYNDVLNADVSLENICKIFDLNEKPQKHLVKVVGYHRRRGPEYQESDIKHKEIIVDTIAEWEMLTNKSLFENNVEDSISILRATKVDIKEMNIVDDQFNISLNIANEVSVISDLTKGIHQGKIENHLVFKTHNVGQALATSISIKDELPIIYFDFGLPHGKNKHTIPNNVSIDIKPSSTIILSHIHMDHWNGISKALDSYSCDWYIPSQYISFTFRKKISEILLSGGNVKLITNTINFNFGKISCESKSKLEPDRKPSSLHQNGLVLYLRGYDFQNNKVSILAPGDQDYDYIEATVLSNIDILVASHHGGHYSWCKKTPIPTAFSSFKPVIIYSYGVNNTYNHPLHISEYRSVGWKQEHHTLKDGDFTFSFYIT